MADHSAAEARVYDIPPSSPARGLEPAVAYPLRFAGRVRFLIDRAALAERVATDMRRVASPRALTDERVRAYCADRCIPHHRFEAAVLHEAFKVVSSDKLIERVAGDLRQRMPEALESRYVCTAERRDGVLLLRLGADATGDPKYVIVGDQPEWSVIPGLASTAGTLAITGDLAPADGDAMRINSSWRIKPGQTCASFGRAAGTCFAPPVRVMIGCVAGDALSRFTRALPRRISTVLEDAREPTFVNVERLLRLGRLTHSTRVYLLYWKRLRDFLIWSVAG